MIPDRFSKLCLLPPPIGTPWSPPPSAAVASNIQRPDGTSVTIDLPLFWDDPGWVHYDPSVADAMAVAVAQLGIPVSALRSELSEPDHGDPTFFHPNRESKTDGEPGDAANTVLPRIVPYRAERYGISELDFDSARVIDVRLTLPRDASGRYAYSPEWLQRWESTPEDAPLAGGGWVPAATFPPDVPTLKHLNSKLQQLRALAPQAAVFVSIGPYDLQQELNAVLASRPDGIIIRAQGDQMDPFELAGITQRARRIVQSHERPELPIWIVPGQLSAVDAVKLIALGASAVAVDAWCQPAAASLQQHLQERTRYTARRSIDMDLVSQLIEETVGPYVEQVLGHSAALGYNSPDRLLGTFDPDWARAIGLPLLGSISDD